MSKIRVLVVDDSLTVRRRLAEVLGADPELEVVGEAEDGKGAIERCAELRPDVMTLDMTMPVMSGVAATEYIMAYFPTPILIVSASTNRGELFRTYDALAAGAVLVFEKPRGDSSDADWERRFCAAVKLVSRIKVITHPRARLTAAGHPSALAPPLDPLPRLGRPPIRVVALGASTGGPAALVEVLRQLPTGFPAPVVIVLHLDPIFGVAFAEWLDAQTDHRVAYARDGEAVASFGGRVAMAPPGLHLTVAAHKFRLMPGPPRHSCRPSIDVLFESIALDYGGSAAACLLTGMGRDGAAGLLDIRKSGGLTIAQDEATSVVYGMPREAALIGAAELVLPLDAIGRTLGARRMILIVDDSLTVRMDLAEAMGEAGLPARACASLAEARAALAQESPTLVILDVVLPDGDGIELLREIRANTTRHTPVLMLSSEAEVADRIRGLQTGADDYVGKPYDIGYVVARSRELLRKSSPSGVGSTILVIDDSPTFREELRHALEQAGYGVLTASSGEQGLRIAAGSRPTAVLVDGILPGIDGTAVIRKIRMDAALRGTPCVLLTGSEGAATELRALDAGADAFIRKEEDLAVILARLAAVLRASSVSRADTPSLLGPRRVLAVDDSATYLQELADMLRGEGYDAVLARSGEEAIELLSVQAVDCILLDLLMPGLGGKETCRRIKESAVVRGIPLIMLTALEDRTAMIEGLAAGADDYISKSNDFEVLKARVRAQLRRKQFEDEHRRIRDELMRSELLAAEERTARQVAETRAALTGELERKNGELEAFSYSVSHDLRAPLRAIDGFSQILLDDYADKLDAKGQDYLARVRAGAQRMAALIEDLLKLSRVSSTDVHRERVDLSAMARAVVQELRHQPERRVDLVVADNLFVQADGGLVRVLMDNLLGNAWKFTARVEVARIEPGSETRDGGGVCFVRDNGAGFDMKRAARLFAPFQRLHGKDEFPGTGIGLATAYRIVDRHGGRVWAEGAVGRGATVFFTLPPPAGTTP